MREKSNLVLCEESKRKRELSYEVDGFVDLEHFSWLWFVKKMWPLSVYICCQISDGNAFKKCCRNSINII